MFQVLIEALIDTLKIAPVLVIIYILIEFLELKTTFKVRSGKVLKGRFAPVAGAAAGLMPQCGFSVMATDMYAKRYLTIGTLLAVYISTSDEAIPILLSDLSNINKLWPLLLIKFVLAVFIGILADIILGSRKKLNEPEIIKQNKKYTIAKNSNIKIEEKAEIKKEHNCNDENCSCNTNNKDKTAFNTFFFHPLLHSLKILLYILIINIIFGFLIYFVGQDAITGFLAGSKLFQPVLTALIGLIPNCASSVIITQLYVIDAINLGSVLSGLIVNAGIALAVLFKLNKNLKENLVITGSLFLISVLTGIIVTLVIV